MLDLSTWGTAVVFTFADGKTITLGEDDISDIGTPFRIGDVSPLKEEFDLNGKMFVRRELHGVRVSLTLLPSDKAVDFLHNLYASRAGDVSPVQSLLVSNAEFDMKEQYLNGYVVSGTGGTGMEHDGRFGSIAVNCVFETAKIIN